jgi:phosphatidylserine/phosphatidylglycerophosphate/cardiolipin synthase-like enzyme
MKPQTKEKLYIIVIILLTALSAQFYFTYHYQPAHEIKVYYNQEHQLNKEIIEVIRDADQFVYFAVYTFTRADIKDALLAAKHRGLTVKGVTDKNQYNALESQKKIIDELRKADIPVFEQDHSAIMHLKTVVTEKAYASGSFNWTASATNLNDEVLEIGRDENIRKQYQGVLEELLSRYKDSM